MAVFDGQEPSWVKAARSAYHLSGIKFRQIENRITRTDSGQAWVDRVKALGRRLKRP